MNHLACKHGKDILVHENLSIRPWIVNFDGKTSVLYQGILQSQSSVISLDKCFHLRVPRGLVSVLEEGQEIVLENGTIVRPEDVSFPKEPEKSFMVMECTDLKLISKLISDTSLLQELNRFVRSLVMQTIQLLFHFQE